MKLPTIRSALSFRISVPTTGLDKTFAVSIKNGKGKGLGSLYFGGV